MPVPDEFTGKVVADRDLAKGLYFLICGVVDPHKNHLFLLDVWEELAGRLGAKTPKLVIVGSAQAGAKKLFERLSRRPALQEYVVVISGLSTPAVRKLMISARALLMPSISEGFGLPIVEALAQGTRVIASDIPAHREAGRGGDVLYLPVSDKRKWLAAIEGAAKARRAKTRPRSTRYKPKTWRDYFSGIESFLDSI